MEPQDIKNLSLYCFSALIQADAAIFGLLAVFVVYQMQSLGNNQMNSYTLISSQATSAKSDFERLLLPIRPEAVHWILMRHGSSSYYGRLMTAAAFTEYWKSRVIEVSKSTFIFLVLHAALASFGLFYANELNTVCWVSPSGRIVIGLSTFVSLLAAISLLGYKFLSRNSYGQVPKPPSIDLTSITLEEFKSLSPMNDEFGHLFSIASNNLNRFISLKRGERNTVNVSCILRSKEGKYLSMQSGERMDDAALNSFIQGLKSDPERYWSNK